MYQDFFNKQDDYLNDFKQKVAEQKNATMEERRSELVRSRNNFLGTFAGIVLAGIVGWFVLAPQYEHSSDEIPVIRRPQTAIKIKPENPGGMDIPNQDKDVYNIVEKKNIDNTTVENLLPTPEKPKLPDIVPDEPEVDVNAKNLDEIVDNVAGEKTNISSEQEKNKIADKATKELEKTLKTAKEEKKSETKTSAPKVAENGAWQIQLIASKNKDSVEKTWNNLTAKYSLLKSYTHEVQSADLGAQGMIYKLRAGSFADKAAAQSVCAALKKQGLNDCIAKER
ncbi:MAG: SPOR domain-containing protein [Alphaproteobacteria bacterium]|nr:SPOR domain-containing protein [Alphaproteobacteria bacterium]